tara:strand:- start:528 stop:1553 length:1026 start_codon:yes stop_codon:yes gene_type:complete
MENYKIIVLAVVFLNCTESDNKKNVAINEGIIPELSITSDTLFTTSDISKNELLIGEIGAFTISDAYDFYLLDKSNYKVLKFDKSGNFVEEFLKGFGRGPNEVTRPNSIYVDREDFIYVTDRDERKFIVLNSNGEFYTEHKVKMMPSKITAIDSTTIFVTGFRFSFKDSNIVRVYKNIEGELIHTNSLGQRNSLNNQMIIDMSGYSDFINVQGGNLIVNRFYPYQFEIFDNTMKRIFEKEVDTESFTAPYREDGLIKLDAVSRELLTMKDFYVNRYLVNGIDYFDLFDKNLNLLSSFKGSELGVKPNAKYFGSYLENNKFYGLYEETYTSVIEYNLVRNEN